MIYLGIIIGMALLSRMAGGGLGAHHLDKYKLTWLPELLFAWFFGFAAAAEFDAEAKSLAFIVGALWSYIWMQTGHGVVLPWGKALGFEHRNRTQTLSPVVDFIADRLKIQKTQADGYSRTRNYCRLFMAVKGFLIGLPAGGLPLAILWPLGYEIGNRYGEWARPHIARKYKAAAIAEFLAGAGAGVTVCLALASTI